MMRGYYVVKLQQVGGSDSFTFENVPLLEDGNYDEENDTGIDFRCELAEWPDNDPSIVQGGLDVKDSKLNRIVWDDIYDTQTEHWLTDFLTTRVREHGQCRIFYGNDTSGKAKLFEIKSVLRC